MGNRGARLAGLREAPVTIQESVEGVTREVSIVDLAKGLRTDRTRRLNRRQKRTAVEYFAHTTGGKSHGSYV